MTTINYVHRHSFNTPQLIHLNKLHFDSNSSFKPQKLYGHEPTRYRKRHFSCDAAYKEEQLNSVILMAHSSMALIDL